MKKIAILIETKNDDVKPAIYGVITAAQSVDHELFAFVFSTDGNTHKDSLSSFGTQNIVSITFKESCLESSPNTLVSPNHRAEAILSAMQRFEIDTLLALTSIESKEVLPRVAAHLDAPLVLDCLEVGWSQETVEKPLFSGKVIGTVRMSGAHQVIGIRPNAIEPKMSPVDARVIPFQYDHPPDNRYQVIDVQKSKSDRVELSEADIIISGGRGMQNEANFQILHDCAKTMGAAVGASRVAVDAGWVPHAMQVGQTGTTVSPKLYIACGISGSVQHFAGMKTAGTIVCINTDSGAAMMQQCDYGIVGDLFEIVPILTRQLKQAR